MMDWLYIVARDAIVIVVNGIPHGCFEEEIEEATIVRRKSKAILLWDVSSTSLYKSSVSNPFSFYMVVKSEENIIGHNPRKCCLLGSGGITEANISGSSQRSCILSSCSSDCCLFVVRGVSMKEYRFSTRWV